MDANIKHIFTNIEKGFNIAGSIPIVSFFSGTLRVVAGKVQALAGGVIASIGFVTFLLTDKQKWVNWTNFGTEFIIHGALNTLRGLGEALLCLYTLVGNVLLLIPNLSKDDKFSPFLAYGFSSAAKTRHALHLSQEWE